MADDHLVIPLYLDIKTLMDLLASVEEGFSIMERITSRSSDSKESEISGSVGFGVANVMNFFGLKLGGAGKRAGKSESDEQRESERFHTYGSLLNRFRKYLLDEKLVTVVANEDSWAQLAPSVFVEVRGKFMPNPLQKTLELLNQLLGFAALVGKADLSTAGQDKNKAKAQLKGMDSIAKALQGLTTSLQSGDIRTYVVEIAALPNHRAVVPLFVQYLRDRSATELDYGEFVVLGKLTRTVSDGDSIDLLRGSAFSGFSEEMLRQFIGSLKEAGQQGIKMPELVTKVEAPAIQIVPIAVYI